MAYYLSRFGIGGPPEALNVNTWNAAYDLFYDTLGNGKVESSFRNSLKNYRDSFDHLFPENNREGWKETLSGTIKYISDRCIAKDHDEVWAEVSKLQLWACCFQQQLFQIFGLFRPVGKQSTGSISLAVRKFKSVGIWATSVISLLRKRLVNDTTKSITMEKVTRTMCLRAMNLHI